ARLQGSSPSLSRSTMHWTELVSRSSPQASNSVWPSPTAPTLRTPRSWRSSSSACPKSYTDSNMSAGTALPAINDSFPLANLMSDKHDTIGPNQTSDVIIIGSGPAGYPAAIYAARANLRPVIFEGAVTAGGALMHTTEVENFPGFPDAIMGPDLMESMRAQAERFGAQLVRDDVSEVSLTGPLKTVTDGAGTTWWARTAILAMGSAYRQMGVADEQRLSGHGVSWCATCDGFFFRGQDVVVVGGGDSAVEEATFLAKFADSVTIVHRRDE